MTDRVDVLIAHHAPRIRHRLRRDWMERNGLHLRIWQSVTSDDFAPSLDDYRDILPREYSNED